jgi:ferrochelatase
MRIAVVIYNLGGPCCIKAVKPFLYNLFCDPAIIKLPKVLRIPLANLISRCRSSKASAIYEQMGGGSPILLETYKQALALEKKLGDEYKVFIYMRYTYPKINDVLDNIEQYKPDKIVLLPLYPQYSTTTTESSLREWEAETTKLGMEIDTYSILSYETNSGFIGAYRELLANIYEEASHLGKPIVLFSAHGIPLNRIKMGDPYERQVNDSVRKVITEMPYTDIEYEVCYQSKVGPLKWLAPATCELIEKYSKEKRVIIVLPISFVSEHSETLVELDIQYKELALKHGAKAYFRVPTVGIHLLYIKSLKDLTNSVLRKNAE